MRAGPVNLYVRTKLSWAGQIVQQGGSALLVGYFGTNDLNLLSSFTGTLIAPSADVRLVGLDAPYVGRFLAANLDVNPGVKLRRR